MQPATPNDFLKVAEQRLAAAEEIMNILHRNLEAQYFAGYCVECSLKALILERTESSGRQKLLQRITRGAAYHRPEKLFDLLSAFGIRLNIDLAKRMRRFDWTTGLRYEIGRKHTGETRGMLKTAEAIHTWVREQMS